MSLFPFFRKNKPESKPGSDGFYSHPEQESSTPRAHPKRSRSGKQEPADPALPEKKRARRRLVGAVALVLALVIGLPMILDSEPKPLASDISIEIPSKNKSMMVPPSVPAPVLPGAAPAKPASLDAAEEIIEPPVAAAAGASTAHGDVKPAVKDKPAIRERAPELALAKPEARGTPEAKPAPHAPASEQRDDAARAKAILEGKFDAPAVNAGAPKAADAKQAKFVVQVAALASPDKVSELRGKLSHAGIASYTQKVATAAGERIRIRVGPFANQEQAEKMRSRLVKLGLNGTLVPA